MNNDKNCNVGSRTRCLGLCPSYDDALVDDYGQWLWGRGGWPWETRGMGQGPGGTETWSRMGWTVVISDLNVWRSISLISRSFLYGIRIWILLSDLKLSAPRITCPATWREACPKSHGLVSTDLYVTRRFSATVGSVRPEAIAYCNS
jgi:hypothetical protein